MKNIRIYKKIIEHCRMCPHYTYVENYLICDKVERVIRKIDFTKKYKPLEIPEWCPLEVF